VALDWVKSKFAGPESHKAHIRFDIEVGFNKGSGYCLLLFKIRRIINTRGNGIKIWKNKTN
jgi:hypothetical protein